MPSCQVLAEDKEQRASNLRRTVQGLALSALSVILFVALLALVAARMAPGAPNLTPPLTFVQENAHCIVCLHKCSL